MALSGVHIVWGYCRGAGIVNSASSPTVLPFGAISSETIASAGTSTTSAPASDRSNRSMLSISASAPIFYAVGVTPNASSGHTRRYYDPASGREDIFVSPGDKFAWIAA